MQREASSAEVTRARRHLQNAAWLTISQAAARVLSFLALVLIQKHLSVADNGVVQLGLRLSFLMSLFTEFGVRGYVVREIARQRENRETAQQILGNVLNLRLALVLPVWMLGTAILWLAGYPRTTLVVVSLFYIFSVADSFAVLFKFVFRAYERMEFDAWFSILGRIVLVGTLWAFWSLRIFRVSSVSAAHVFSGLAEALLLSWCVWKILGLRLRTPWDSVGVSLALRRSVPFAVINIIGTLYMSTGTIALSKMLGEEAVGYYNAAARLPEALQFLPTAFVNALIPFLSRHHEEKELVAQYYQKLVRYLGYAGVIFSCIFLFLPEWIILLVAKEDYLSAATVFRFYGVWLLLVFYQIIAANLLICLNAEKIVMARAVLALSLNVVLNVAGIRMMGLNGAALALVLTEAVSAMMYFIALARRGVGLAGQTVVRLLIAGLSVALPILLLNRLASDTLRVAAGVVSGIGVTLFLLWHDDRKLLEKLVRGR